jgi:hypothetical protein
VKASQTTFAVITDPECGAGSYAFCLADEVPERAEVIATFPTRDEALRHCLQLRNTNKQSKDVLRKPLEPSKERPLGPPEPLPPDGEVEAALDRLAKDFPLTAEAGIALLKIGLVVKRTRHRWLADSRAHTERERAAARELRDALTKFFRAYRGFVFGPTIDARKEIERILDGVDPADEFADHDGKLYRLRVDRVPAEVVKEQFEAELYSALREHGLAKKKFYTIAHDALKGLCALSGTQADSALRLLRERRRLATRRMPKKPPKPASLADALLATSELRASSRRSKRTLPR